MWEVFGKILAFTAEVIRRPLGLAFVAGLAVGITGTLVWSLHKSEELLNLNARISALDRDTVAREKTISALQAKLVEGTGKLEEANSSISKAAGST